jgi:outer membrane protein TolC
MSAQKMRQKTVEQQYRAGASDRLEVLASQIETAATTVAQLDTQAKLQEAIGALEAALQRPLETNVSSIEQSISLEKESSK